MSTEDRLRDALHARAATVEPHADGWERINQRLRPTPRTRVLRYTALATAAAIALVVAVVATTSRPDDSNPLVTEPGTSTTSTTSTTAVAMAPAFIWPFDDGATYDTPESLADGFARDFLGMPHPRISTYRAGDNNSGEIDVHPNPRGTIGSMLLVRRTLTGWKLLSAMSQNLQLDTPAALDEIASPVTLKGRSIAFEGTVRVSVLRYGTTMRCAYPTDSCGSDHGVLANTFFTGNGTEPGPFQTTVRFNPSSTPTGLVVLWTDSAEDGTLAEATVRLVRFS